MPIVPRSEGPGRGGSPHVNPNVFAPINRALQGIGGMLVQYGEQRDQELLLEARTRFTKALNEAQLKAEDTTIPPEQIVSNFDEEMKSAKEGINQDLFGGNQKLASHFDAITAESQGSRGLVVSHIQHKRLADKSVALLKEDIDETLKEIALTSDAEQAQRSYLELKVRVASNPYLSDEEKLATDNFVGRSMDFGAAVKMSELNPHALDAILKDSTLKQFVSAFPELDPIADRAKLQQIVDSRLEKERALQASNLEIAVKEGRAGEGAINAAFENDIISGPKRTELILTRRDRIAAAVGAVKDRSRFRAVMAGEEQFDPHSSQDQKLVDSVFNAEIAPTIETLSTSQSDVPASTARSAITAEIVSKIGIIPTQIQNDLNGKLLNGSPEDVVAAADTIDRIMTKNPNIAAQLSGDSREIALHVSTLTRAGVEPETAVKRVNESRKQPKAEIEVRSERYTRERDSNAKWLSSQTSKWFSFDSKVPDGMLGEFNALAEESYKRTGDINVARNSAIQDIRRTWGETRVNGKREWMKYAPEIYYANPSFGSDDIRAQLVSETKDRFPNLDETKIVVAPSLNTARTASSGTPSYMVLIQDESGEFVPAPSLGPWRPSFEMSEKGAELLRERQRDTESARRRKSSISQEYHELSGGYEAGSKGTSSVGAGVAYSVGQAASVVKSIADKTKPIGKAIEDLQGMDLSNMSEQ